MLGTRRRGFSVTLTPAQASLTLAGRIPGVSGSNPDTVPEAFDFTDQTGVSQSVTVTSTAITVAGIDAPASIIVSGDPGSAYDINGSGSFVTTPGTVSNGNTVRAQHTSSGSASTQRNTTVTIGGVSGVFTSTTGGAVSGFTVDNGIFSVDGTAGHDQPLTITRSTGTFATRQFGSGTQFPWLYDRVSAQYKNGVNQNAYAALSNGAAVPTGNVWGKNTYAGGTATYYTTSRSMRSSLYTAMYTNEGHLTDKCGLGDNPWPTAWGLHANRRIYCSWWAKAAQGFTVAQHPKTFRLEDSNTNGLDFVGHDAFCSQTFIAGFGGAAVAGFYNGGGSPPSNAAWTRFEVYYDKDAQTASFWVNGKFAKTTNSSAGGDFEFRPAGQKLYTSSTRDDTRWNSAAVSGSGLWPAIIGYDSNGATSGQICDISEIYVDADLARFEISDSSTWSRAPGTTQTFEICGRWSRNSSTQCTVYPNQGGFASLTGKYLWYVTSETAATLIGHFT